MSSVCLNMTNYGTHSLIIFIHKSICTKGLVKPQQNELGKTWKLIGVRANRNLDFKIKYSLFSFNLTDTFFQQAQEGKLR